jgi:hypothetical protein
MLNHICYGVYYGKMSLLHAVEGNFSCYTDINTISQYILSRFCRADAQSFEKKPQYD